MRNYLSLDLKHIVLGMHIKIKNDNKIEIDMIKQRKETTEWLDKQVEKIVYSPSNNKIVYL